jgi:hypothetical protein
MSIWPASASTDDKNEYLLPLRRLLDLVAKSPGWSFEEYSVNLPKDQQDQSPLSVSQVRNILTRLSLHTVALRRVQHQKYPNGFFDQRYIQNRLPGILIYLKHSGMHKQVNKSEEKTETEFSETSTTLEPVISVETSVNNPPVIEEVKFPEPVQIQEEVTSQEEQKDIVIHEEVTQEKIADIETEPIPEIETPIKENKSEQDTTFMFKEESMNQEISHEIMQKEKKPNLLKQKIKAAAVNFFNVKFILFIVTALLLISVLGIVLYKTLIITNSGKANGDLSLPVSTQSKGR